MENAEMKYTSKLLTVLCLIFLTSCYFEGVGFKISKYIKDNSEIEDLSQVHFAYNSFKGLSSETLETNALPYKLITTAILMRRSNRDQRKYKLSYINNVFLSFGLFTPKEISNWKQNIPKVKLDRPVGMIRGKISFPFGELEAVNFGCASCHGGMLHDNRGDPTGKMWLGLPNTSLNLEAYIDEVYKSIVFMMKNQSDFFIQLVNYYPDISKKEFKTIKKTVFPLIIKSMKDLKAINRGTPFPNGSPGNTNGVSALKFRLGMLNLDQYYKHEAGFTSIPDLSNRQMRSSYLYDGLYSVPGEDPFVHINKDEAIDRDMSEMSAIVSHFTIPSIAIKIDKVPKIFENIEMVMNGFLKDYQAPKFPGVIDIEKSKKGKEIYQNLCSNCHGDYDDNLPFPKLISFPNKLIPLKEIGTDPLRAITIDQDFIDRFEGTDIADYIQLNKEKGYVAPILSGLWSTAPYLHNGSVPTLWQLLNPKRRPCKFQVGGHKLDMKNIGVDGIFSTEEDAYIYPSNYSPWSQPYLFNCSKENPGQSNLGHEKQFENLPKSDKRNLIEYLKLL